LIGYQPKPRKGSRETVKISLPDKPTPTHTHTGKEVKARYKAVTGGFDPMAFRGLALGVNV
jgi:hypothetical protein